MQHGAVEASLPPPEGPACQRNALQRGARRLTGYLGAMGREDWGRAATAADIFVGTGLSVKHLLEILLLDDSSPTPRYQVALHTDGLLVVGLRDYTQRAGDAPA